jgi:hypothetical protein
MAQPRRSKLPRRLGRAPVALGAAPVPDKISEIVFPVKFKN